MNVIPSFSSFKETGAYERRTCLWQAEDGKYCSGPISDLNMRSLNELLTRAKRSEFWESTHEFFQDIDLVASLVLCESIHEARYHHLLFWEWASEVQHIRVQSSLGDGERTRHNKSHEARTAAAITQMSRTQVWSSLPLPSPDVTTCVKCRKALVEENRKRAGQLLCNMDTYRCWKERVIALDELALATMCKKCLKVKSERVNMVASWIMHIHQGRVPLAAMGDSSSEAVNNVDDGPEWRLRKAPTDLMPLTTTPRKEYTTGKQRSLVSFASLDAKRIGKLLQIDCIAERFGHIDTGKRCSKELSITPRIKAAKQITALKKKAASEIDIQDLITLAQNLLCKKGHKFHVAQDKDIAKMWLEELTDGNRRDTHDPAEGDQRTNMGRQDYFGTTDSRSKYPMSSTHSSTPSTPSRSRPPSADSSSGSSASNSQYETPPSAMSIPGAWAERPTRPRFIETPTRRQPVKRNPAYKPMSMRSSNDRGHDNNSFVQDDDPAKFQFETMLSDLYDLELRDNQRTRCSTKLLQRPTLATERSVHSHIVYLLRNGVSDTDGIGCLYVYSMETRDEHVKIGRSTNVPGRTCAQEKQCGHKIFLHNTAERSKNSGQTKWHVLCEKLVHAELNRQAAPAFFCEHCEQKHEEWFTCDFKVALNVVDRWRDWLTNKDVFGEIAGNRRQLKQPWKDKLSELVCVEGQSWKETWDEWIQNVERSGTFQRRR